MNCQISSPGDFIDEAVLDSFQQTTGGGIYILISGQF